MALPALRAGILLTTAAAATGTLLYEHHEPFRTWADDVSGRAQAAWVGIKEEFRELKDDIEGHAQRRQEAPYGGRSGQWEGVGVRGPWRRGRGRRRGNAAGDTQRATATTTETEIREGEGQLRKRRGSLHDGQWDSGKIAREALDSDAILSSQPSGLQSRASTETMRSAREEALHEEAHEHNALTPVTTTSTIDWDDSASMSVVSAPSEADVNNDVEILTPTEGSEGGIMTPMSGMMTPTSSSAGELNEFEELRRRTDGEGSDIVDRDETMDDARSEASGISEWSKVSDEPAQPQAV